MMDTPPDSTCHLTYTGGHALDTSESSESGTPSSLPDWESDMADLASMPIQGITDLEVPLPVRLLTELRRSRGNLTGGSNPGRAE